MSRQPARQVVEWYRGRMTDHDPELLADPFLSWVTRADGKTHTLVRGVHYTRDPKLVRKAAAMWGHRHGYRCFSRHDEQTVRVKFTPKQDPM